MGIFRRLLGQPDHLQGLLGLLSRPYGIFADVERPKHHFLQNRRSEDLVVGILKHQSDERGQGSRRHFVRRTAEDVDLPPCGLQQTLQQLYEGCFAGPVLTDDGRRFFIKIERNPLEDLFTGPVGEAHILYDNPAHRPFNTSQASSSVTGKWGLPSLFAFNSRQTRVYTGGTTPYRVRSAREKTDAGEAKSMIFPPSRSITRLQ